MKRMVGFTLLTLVAFAAIGALAQPDGRRPRDGACFFSDINFRGDVFCVPVGTDAGYLPGMNDRIRSVEIVGNAQVTAFNDPEFRGENITLRGSVPDLRQIPLASTPGKNWHTRISSVRVFAMRRDDDHDRDRDRDDWRKREDHEWHGDLQAAPSTVQCGADRERRWCDADRPVFQVRLVRTTGERRCEWGETFGLERGRLWTARGCAGVFEIR